MIVCHGRFSDLEKILPVLATAIGIPLTDRAAHEIVELLDRRTFSMDEFPDVPGTFERRDDHLLFISDPGQLDVDMDARCIDFVHPNDAVTHAVACRVRESLKRSA